MIITGDKHIDDKVSKANEKAAEIVRQYEANPQTAQLVKSMLDLTIIFRTIKCLEAQEARYADQINTKYEKLIETDIKDDVVADYVAQITEIMKIS